MTLDELKAAMKAKLEEARNVAKAAEDADREFTPEERNKVKGLLDDANGLKRQVDEKTGDREMLDALNAFSKSLVDPKGAPDPKTGELPGVGGTLAGVKSIGQRVVEDDAYNAWLKSITVNGRIPEQSKGLHSPAVPFKLGDLGAKSILTGTDDAQGGALVRPDWLGLIDQGRFRKPLVLRNLVSTGRTTTDTIEYARELAYTNNADFVPEASGTSAGTASGDVSGTKPESDFTLERVSTTVKTLAHWMAATKRALSDAAQIRTLIDNFLEYGLEETLEDSMLNGDGSGETLEGILNVSGTTAQAWDTDLLTTTRKARTKVRTVGRATPSAYLLNPADNEAIDLLKNLNGDYYFGGPSGMGVSTLWGLPRVESEFVPAGTGIVADFSRAILWDREQAGIQVSDSHADFFVRNLVAILAEMRVAFGVIRPSAFVVIDLTA